MESFEETRKNLMAEFAKNATRNEQCEIMNDYADKLNSGRSDVPSFGTEWDPNAGEKSISIPSMIGMVLSAMTCAMACVPGPTHGALPAMLGVAGLGVFCAISQFGGNVDNPEPDIEERFGRVSRKFNEALSHRCTEAAAYGAENMPKMPDMLDLSKTRARYGGNLKLA